jgi:hypothetical protein
MKEALQAGADGVPAVVLVIIALALLVTMVCQGIAAIVRAFRCKDGDDD